MALQHSQPLEVIDMRPLGSRLRESKTCSLLKTDHLQLMRVVLLERQALPQHHVPGKMTLLCIEGQVRVNVRAGTHELGAGELMMLPADEPHAVVAVRDASLLMTVLLPD